MTLSEERTFPHRMAARLMRIRDLSADTKGPVRIVCIVVEAREGSALVQDLMDEVGRAATIEAVVEGTLEVAQKYILFGEVTEKRNGEEKKLILSVSLAHNVNTLDIKEFKRALELEAEVIQKLVK